MIFKRKRPGGLSCREVGKNLQSFLDNESVEPCTVDQLEQHLELCRACGLEADAYRRIKDALGRRGQAISAVDGVDRLRAFGEELIAREP